MADYRSAPKRIRARLVLARWSLGVAAALFTVPPVATFAIWGCEWSRVAAVECRFVEEDLRCTCTESTFLLAASTRAFAVDSVVAIRARGAWNAQPGAMWIGALSASGREVDVSPRLARDKADQNALADRLEAARIARSEVLVAQRIGSVSNLVFVTPVVAAIGALVVLFLHVARRVVVTRDGWSARVRTAFGRPIDVDLVGFASVRVRHTERHAEIELVGRDGAIAPLFSVARERADGVERRLDALLF